MKKFRDLNQITKFIFITGALLCGHVVADETDNLRTQVSTIAEDYVRTQISAQADSQLSVQAMPIDERIQIPACDGGYQASASSNSLQQSNVTVRINCAMSDWYLYLMVKVAQTIPVVIASNALSPNVPLTSSDVQQVEMDKNTLRNSTFADITEVIGARTKRRIRAGQPITPELLCFVCKGDIVTIHADIGGIEIKTSGTAMQDGNIGEQIQVKNTRSERNVFATVQSPSDVRVNL